MNEPLPTSTIAQTPEQFKQRYQLVGIEADYRESGQTIDQFLQNPNREIPSYKLDTIVRDRETGKLFFVTNKGVRENQLASRIGELLASKNEKLAGKIHIPEMKKANFGEGNVVLVEYAEKTKGLDEASNLIHLVDTETGAFTSSWRTWIGDWDNKAGNLLIQDINGKKVLVPIDFEMAFGANDAASIITNGKKLTPAEIQERILSLMAEKDPFLKIVPFENYQHSLSVIKKLDDQDYALIKKMAIESGYTESQAEKIITTLQTRAKTLENDIKRITTSTAAQTKASRISENTIEYHAATYKYDTKTRTWRREEVIGEHKLNNPTIPISDIADKQTIVKLEAARLELPVSLIEESVSTFEDLIQPSATGTFSPHQYEQHIFNLVNRIDDHTQLTKENIRELVLNRASQEVKIGAMTQTEFHNLERDFSQLYDKSIESTKDIPELSEILAHQEPGFTNVHLFRDGSVLGSSDLAYQKLIGVKDPNVRIIYVSRDSTLQQSNKMIDIIDIAAFKSSSVPEFQKEILVRFNDLMAKDPEFKDAVEMTYKYLQSEGLIGNEKKLRFIDTCCTGSINLFLEGVVMHYNPNMKVRSLLMQSGVQLNNGIKPLTAGLKGYSVEGLHKQSQFAKEFDAQGQPLMASLISKDTIGDENNVIQNIYGFHADQTLAFMDQLTVLKQTAQKASGIK